MTDLVDSSGTTHYTYDALQRLTGVTYPNGDTVSYGYDAVGNRTSLTVNRTATTNTFDAANELTAFGSDTYSYDENGNLTSKIVGGMTTTYSYDALNQLTNLSGPINASHIYNGDSLLVSKTVKTSATHSTWAQTGLGRLPSQIAAGTNTPGLCPRR